MITQQNRPLPLRLLPPQLRMWLFHRFYRSRRSQWKSLYQNAQLDGWDVSMQLLPGDYISDQIAFTGIYEEALTRRVIELGRRGGTMIDVGANLGYFSLLWAASHPSSRCMAVEAAPRNLAMLRENISRNGFAERIRVIPCAAAAQPGKVQFDLGPDDQTGWGGIASEQTAAAIEVDAVRIDHMVSPDEPIELLKVDTEGADTLVLMGCEELLKRKMVREVWFEQNKPRMKQLGIPPEQAQLYLQSMGYSCEPREDTGGALVEWVAVPRFE